MKLQITVIVNFKILVPEMSQSLITVPLFVTFSESGIKDKKSERLWCVEDIRNLNQPCQRRNKISEQVKQACT